MIVSKLIVAAVAGAVAGGGAMAVSPSLAATTTTSTHAAHAASTPSARNEFRSHRNVLYADWTTRNGVHHESIRGKVTSVSADSITVTATDGKAMTFSVGKDTRVRVLRDGRRTQESIADVKTGDRALVVARGAEHATWVIAKAPRKSAA